MDIKKLLFVGACLCVQTHAVNNQPVIGILTQTSSKSVGGDFYLDADYVKYLEAAGAKVIPIKIHESERSYEELFNKINGVLFPGGGVNILKSPYAKTAKIMYNLALKANSRGDYFPLWGTCLGFQTLTALTSGQDLLSKFDSENLALPLNFQPDYRKSKLFRNAPPEVIEILKTRNVTANYHHYGITPTIFNATSSLKNFYHVLSVNADRNSRTFVSTMEAFNFPIYGTQWHPEKNQFYWNVKAAIKQTKDAVAIGQYMANFFVSEARKSNHHFPDVQSESATLIENYRMTYDGQPSYYQVYIFHNNTQDKTDSKYTRIKGLFLSHAVLWYVSMLLLLVAVLFTLCWLVKLHQVWKRQGNIQHVEEKPHCKYIKLPLP